MTFCTRRKSWKIFSKKSVRTFSIIRLLILSMNRQITRGSAVTFTIISWRKPKSAFRAAVNMSRFLNHFWSPSPSLLLSFSLFPFSSLSFFLCFISLFRRVWLRLGFYVASHTNRLDRPWFVFHIIFMEYEWEKDKQQVYVLHLASLWCSLYAHSSSNRPMHNNKKRNSKSGDRCSLKTVRTTCQRFF